VNRMDSLGVIEDSFRQGGLACVDVGTDADVSQILNILGHEKTPMPAQPRVDATPWAADAKK